jgi:hypothetical protein
VCKKEVVISEPVKCAYLRINNDGEKTFDRTWCLAGDELLNVEFGLLSGVVVSGLRLNQTLA